MYSRGRRGAPAKGVGRETVARVQIPPSPPRETQLNHQLSLFLISIMAFILATDLKTLPKSMATFLIYQQMKFTHTC